MSFEDAFLLDSVRKKDRGAPGALFDQYAAAIFKYALRFCQDTAQAAAVVEEVFAWLAADLRSGAGPSNQLRPYLYQLAYRCLLDRWPGAVPAGLALPEQGLPLSAGAQEQAVLAGVYASLQNSLTPEQQQVLILRYMEGFTLDETADVIGITAGQVEMLQISAMAQLSTALNGAEALEEPL